MPKKPISLNRLSPTQLILVVILLAAAAIYQYWNQGSSSPAPLPPTDTPQQSNHAPSVTPEENVPPTDTPAPPDNQPLADPPPTIASVPDSMSDFDYFVLALSWSPDYCAANGSSDPQQCSIGKKLGFVLHGLWPQYKQGYPSNCSTQKMPAAAKTQFAGLYPNESLFDHEWEKHGTCTGLPPTGYLTLTRQIKTSVNIPNAFRSPEQPFRINVNQLKQEFVQQNPGYAETNLEVNCSSSGRYLKELYVCFSREGQPAACGADVHKEALKSCQKADFLVRNTR
jgi:ribonuclease T2